MDCRSGWQSGEYPQCRSEIPPFAIYLSVVLFAHVTMLKENNEPPAIFYLPRHGPFANIESDSSTRRGVRSYDELGSAGQLQVVRPL